MKVKNYPLFPIPSGVIPPPQPLQIDPQTEIKNLFVDNTGSFVPVWIYLGNSPNGIPVKIPAGGLRSQPVAGTMFLYAQWQGTSGQIGQTFISVADTPMPAALYTPQSSYPQGAFPFAGFSNVRLTGTGAAQAFNVEGLTSTVNSYNIGQSVYVTGFGLLGQGRQAYTLTLGLYDQDGVTPIASGVGIAVRSGIDIQPFGLPIPMQFGTFAKAGSGGNFFVASSIADTIVGSLVVDVFVCGYIS